MIIPFPSFEPDKASYNTQASMAVTNAFPTPDGWGPLPGFTAFSSALPGAPRGSITARTAEGVQVTVCGTGAKLYRVNNDGTLTDISTGTYSVPVGDDWSFALYGNRIVATNLNNGPQYYDIGSSSAFAPLPGSPPKARYVKVIGDFLALFQLASSKASIQWSGINNSEQWVPGEELSDINTFPDGEELMAVAVVGSGATLAFRTGFRTMTFDPSSGYVFSFSPLIVGNGCAASRSLVEIGSGDFVYYSNTGFYRGPSGQPIGTERVDRWFMSMCPSANRGGIKGVLDPVRRAVFWRYLDTNNEGQFIGYHYLLDRWFISDASVTNIGLYATSAISLEELDTLYGSLDAIPKSLDAESFAGGPPAFAGFDNSYRLGFFDGNPQAATLYTNAIEMTPGSRTYVDPMRVITDADRFTAQVGKLAFHGDAPVWGATLTPNSRSRLVNARSDARLHMFRLDIPQGAVWKAATGIDLQPQATSQL